MIKKENDSLRKELNAIHEYRKNFKFRPSVSWNYATIKVGQTYNAEVGLTFADNRNPPKVFIRDTYSNGEEKTLSFNSSKNSALYSIKTRDTGNYIWTGRIINNFENDTNEYLFQVHYRVIK